MKREVRRLTVYFLSLAMLVLLNTSIPVYARELAGNVEVESVELINEKNNGTNDATVLENNVEEGVILEEDTEQTTSGVFGESNGFSWVYDESTYTLTITGEDKGINGLIKHLPNEIIDNVKKLVFQDCIVKDTWISSFDGCSNLISVNLSGLDAPNVTDMSWMFDGCSNLISVNLSGLDASNVTDMSHMFDGCSSLSDVNLSGLDASNVTDMSWMFYGCNSLSDVNLSGLDASNVTDMSGMFFECVSLSNVELNDLNTSNVTDMRDMFYGCETLSSIDLSDFDTGNVTNMSAMFSFCESLTSLDISGFDTSNVTDMSTMFQDCKSLKNVDVSDFDTSNVTDMGFMFSACNSLVSIDVSGFDTSNVTDMSLMFQSCDSLESVDLSGLDVSNVTDMRRIFWFCSSLESVDLSGLDITNVTNVEEMFSICSKLTNIVTPKAMSEGVVIELPAKFEDSQKNIVTEITSAHCNKILKKVKDEYSITYYLDGGKNHVDNPVTYNKSSKTITLKEPKKTGYTFKGWYSDSKFTKKVTAIPAGTTGNRTLYAKWTPNKYNIVFKGNGSTSGSMKKVSERKYGSQYILSANAFKRTGYTFIGWNTKADGTGTSYVNKANVKNLTTKNASTVTLYAQWKVKKYDIAYKLNGGKNNSKNPESYTVKSSSITLKKPTKKGYKFVGWYSDKKCTKKVTKIKKGSTGTKTLYAKWKKK